MRRFGPVLAAALVVVVNAVILAGVAYNRAGVPEAVVPLTERELSLPSHREKEDTGLALRLVWSVDQRNPAPPKEDRLCDSYDSSTPDWIEEAKLASLGFDRGVSLTDPAADIHYARMLPRPAYVVLEYEGDAWARWLAAAETESAMVARRVAEGKATEEDVERCREVLKQARLGRSRLFAVDAGVDPDVLRGRYADRSRYIIWRGSVRIDFLRWKEEGTGEERRSISGTISEVVPPEIHVPPDSRAALENLPAEPPPGKSQPRHFILGGPRYEVEIRNGRRLEPWITRIKRMEPSTGGASGGGERPGDSHARAVIPIRPAVREAALR